MSVPATRTPTASSLTPIFLLLGATAALLFLLSGVPNAESSAPPRGGGGLPPTLRPLQQSSLTSNNARIGEVFRVAVHARPQVAVWLLASANTGPSNIGGWPVDVGADWFFLQEAAWTGGGDQVSLEIAIPYQQAWIGTEAIVQAMLYDPISGEFAVSNSALHRFTDAPHGGKRVLMVRQVSGLGLATQATWQADLLAATLRHFGHQVDVYDDALPNDMAGYDALMDCRFSLAPDPSEAEQMTRFLQLYGGVFLLCGQTVGSPDAQWRFAFIRQFLNHNLGLGLVIANGANLSTYSGPESVSTQADPRMLNLPSAIASMPFEVSAEGGNFGPSGYQQKGTPLIVGPGPLHTAYGMLFKPSDVEALPVQGGVAVLFSGAPDALTTSSSSPYADIIFNNLVHWLDG